MAFIWDTRLNLYLISLRKFLKTWSIIILTFTITTSLSIYQLAILKILSKWFGRKKKERGKERKESEQSVVTLQLVNKNHIIIFLLTWNEMFHRENERRLRLRERAHQEEHNLLISTYHCFFLYFLCLWWSINSGE